MLRQEQKNQLIDARLMDYDIKLYNLEIDVVALQTVGDTEGLEGVHNRIDSLRRARAEVEKLKVIENADT
jgi:hypothetical protein